MYCRICLLSNTSSKYINCQIYKKYFIDVAQIEVYSTDLQYLCSLCAHKVEASLKFRTQAIDADAFLRKIYENLQTEENIPWDAIALKKESLNIHNLSTYPPLCVELPEVVCGLDLFESNDRDDALFERQFVVFVPETRKIEKIDHVSDIETEECEFDKTCVEVFPAAKISEVRKRKKQKLIRRDKKTIGHMATKTRITDYGDKIEEINLTLEEQISELKRCALKDAYVESLYKCALCSIGFGFKETYEGHMQKHVKSNGGLECSVCHCFFRNRHSLDSHTRYVHRKRYRCRKCDFMRVTKMLVVEHYRQKHDRDADLKPFMCEKCNLIFEKYSALRRHSWKEHKSKGPVPCQHCGKILANSSSLRAHLTSVHASEKPFECESCPMRFVTRANLKAHSVKHSTARSFYCAECDVSFKSEYTLRGHLKYSVKHLDSDTFRQCPQCPDRFPSNQTLDNHVYKAHLEVRRFQCTSCPKSFYSVSGLSHHKARIHDGKRQERKFTCEICGRRFAVKKSLRSHINIHTGARPFECKLCDATFGHDASLYTHNRLVHLKIKKKPQIKKKRVDENKS